MMLRNVLKPYFLKLKLTLEFDGKVTISNQQAQNSSIKDSLTKTLTGCDRRDINPS